MRRKFHGLGLLLTISVLNCKATTQAEGCSDGVSLAALDRASRSSAATNAESTWQDRILQGTQSMPTDSVLKVVTFFRSGPTPSDSTYIAERGGHVYYAFRGFPAYSVAITVVDLRALASGPPYVNLENVQIGISGVRTGCDE